jgi:hypothetical protein
VNRSVGGLPELSILGEVRAGGTERSRRTKRGREERTFTPRLILRPFALLRAEQAQDGKKLKVGQAESRW